MYPSHDTHTHTFTLGSAAAWLNSHLLLLWSRTVTLHPCVWNCCSVWLTISPFSPLLHSTEASSATQLIAPPLQVKMNWPLCLLLKIWMAWGLNRNCVCVCVCVWGGGGGGCTFVFSVPVNVFLFCFASFHNKVNWCQSLYIGMLAQIDLASMFYVYPCNWNYFSVQIHVITVAGFISVVLCVGFSFVTTSKVVWEKCRHTFKIGKGID